MNTGMSPKQMSFQLAGQQAGSVIVKRRLLSSAWLNEGIEPATSILSMSVAPVSKTYSQCVHPHPVEEYSCHCAMAWIQIQPIRLFKIGTTKSFLPKVHPCVSQNLWNSNTTSRINVPLLYIKKVRGSPISLKWKNHPCNNNQNMKWKAKWMKWLLWEISVELSEPFPALWSFRYNQPRNTKQWSWASVVKADVR